MPVVGYFSFLASSSAMLNDLIALADHFGRLRLEALSGCSDGSIIRVTGSVVALLLLHILGEECEGRRDHSELDEPAAVNNRKRRDEESENEEERGIMPWRELSKDCADGEEEDAAD